MSKVATRTVATRTAARKTIRAVTRMRYLSSLLRLLKVIGKARRIATPRALAEVMPTNVDCLGTKSMISFTIMKSK